MNITSKTEDAISIAQARSLIGSNSCINEIAINSSIIRSILWIDSQAQNPIHTTRIINQTIKFTLNASSEPSCREKIKVCLNKLNRAGDLASFTKGKWLPGALREIIIDSELGESLLVGGVPSNVFPKQIVPKIIHHKQFRKMPTGLIDELHNLPKLALNYWAQVPEEELESWATKIKALPLKESTTSQERQQFEIYIPQSQKYKGGQYSRWKQKFEGISGIYLCKNSSITGTYYHIAELKKGEIIALSNDLPNKYYSRFMYAEDLAHDKSVVSNVEIKNGELIVKLFNRIPLGEYSIFDALGEIIVEPPNFLVWKFDMKYKTVVFDALQRLKIKIEG